MKYHIQARGTSSQHTIEAENYIEARKWIMRNLDQDIRWTITEVPSEDSVATVPVYPELVRAASAALALLWDCQAQYEESWEMDRDDVIIRLEKALLGVNHEQ